MGIYFIKFYLPKSSLQTFSSYGKLENCNLHFAVMKSGGVATIVPFEYKFIIKSVQINKSSKRNVSPSNIFFQNYMEYSNDAGFCRLLHCIKIYLK